MKKVLAIILASILMFTTAAYASTSVKAYTPMDESSKIRNNIELAVEEIDGTTVRAGATFSFNDTVGPRTKERGYVNARNGRDVYVMGGGVSQVAATLYLALLDLQSGIEFDELAVYGRGEFKAEYVADRNFAVVTDYAADQDFTFINRFDCSLKISMWIDDDRLYCKLSTSGDEDLSMKAVFIDWNSKYQPEDTKRLGTSKIYLNSSTTSKAMTKNITRAAAEIHNMTIKPGEVFSFNEVVGPRTQRFGYINAKNGRGDFVVGGAVSQVASALWLAIDDIKGINVIDMTTYGKDYNQTYVDDADDAIVTDFKYEIDFAFRNDRDDDITIAMFIEDSVLYCRVYEDQ